MTELTSYKSNDVHVQSTSTVTHNHEDTGKKENSYKRCSNFIAGALENAFAKLGGFIASHTYIMVIGPIVISLLFLIGLIDKYDENRPYKLWVPDNSKPARHRQWYNANYPPQLRICNVIVIKDNLLTPPGLATLCDIDEGIKRLRKNDSDTPNLSWDNTCFSPARDGKCLSSTLLEVVWKGNCTYIRSLKTSEIIAHISNFMKRAGGGGGQWSNINNILGGITFDDNGALNVKGAKVTKMTYLLKNREKYDRKEGRLVDVRGQAWEELFVEFLGKQFPTSDASDPSVLYYTITNYRKDSSSNAKGDLPLLFTGYVLIIFYLAVMLGSFSRVKHKVWLAICGIVCIGLSVGVSYGLSSAFQLSVSPVHGLLPFLLLGIGVDDLFVIIQNWENHGESGNIASTMQHAGVSILVTSFTDACAFFIGATTVLPALRSFCIFAGIGIIAIFLLTCTFFVACLELDSRRQRSARDACCCCIKMPSEWQPMKCSKHGYLQWFMKNIFSKAVLSVPGRIIVIFVFLGILAGGAYGLSQLRQDFDVDWLLPPDSVTARFRSLDKKYFTDGIQAAVYTTDKVDYFAEQTKFNTLYEKIDSNQYVVAGSTESWYKEYSSWLNTSQVEPENKTQFHKYLANFLNTREGAQFKSDIKMDINSNEIKASRIRFTHIKLEGASQRIKAMDGIQSIAKSMNFKGEEAFAYTHFYIAWERDKIISTELIRNLILASVVVFVVTLFLMADILASFMVFSCVVFTLIDIAGYMHFWGLTVDTVTTIQLILAVGLSVDYSAHIGHGFMASGPGTRVERARKTLISIGPAVFHGGFSTFLAFVSLAGSQSYIFFTFFRVFFLVVVFGLFHGLVYLPVVLSLIGPPPYATVQMPPDKEGENAVRKSSLAEDEVYVNEKPIEKSNTEMDSRGEISYPIDT